MFCKKYWQKRWIKLFIFFVFISNFLLNFVNATTIDEEADNNNDSNSDETGHCPEGCLCEETDTLFCNNIELTKVPSYWPTHYHKIILRNTSLTTLHKNSFRKFRKLEELRIEESFQLDVIDKYAFKGLHKLRILSLSKNPNLSQIYKATFSGIGNENSLKIYIKNNKLQVIHGYAFKNVNNLRELSIEDECITFSKHSLSSISILDFLSIQGACKIDAETFLNTTRVHNLHISSSVLNLTKKTFDGLSHVNHILIQNNQIGKISEDTFAGSSTIGNLQIQTNKIDEIEPRAFASTENLGTVIISQNTINLPLRTPECVLNDAQRFIFTDNTVYCGCAMKWIKYHSDRSILKENFCGREEAFKALIYYEPRGCRSDSEASSTTTTSLPPMLQEQDYMAEYFPVSSAAAPSSASFLNLKKYLSLNLFFLFLCYYSGLKKIIAQLF